MDSLLNVLLHKVWDGRCCIKFSCRSRRPMLFYPQPCFPFASNVNLIFMPVAPLIFLSRIYSLTEQILVWYLQSHIGFCPIFVK